MKRKGIDQAKRVPKNTPFQNIPVDVECVVSVIICYEGVDQSVLVD